MGRGGGIDCRDVAKEEAEVAKDSRWANWAEEAVSVIRRNRMIRDIRQEIFRSVL